MKIYIISILLFSFVLVSWSGCLANKSIELEVSEIMHEYEGIGLSVIVVRNNKICYKNTFGYNPDYGNKMKRDPLKYDGVFWWASVSKTFISTSIMQLVEKGTISLIDDVNDYLDFELRNPRYPNTPITIQMLLCHRSSLNDKGYRFGFEKLIPENYANYGENYNTYEPGKGYFYCNMNYNLLAAIVEKATGLRFDDYIEQNITEPLGLYGSFNKLKLDSTKFVKTYNYNQKKKEFEKYNYPKNRQYTKDSLENYILGRSTPVFSPAGGMRANIEAVAKFMLVHMNYGTYKKKRILSKESELLMWEPKGSETKYGFAFSHYDKVVKGKDFVGMTGGSCGIHSAMFFNPEKKYGFVIICNGCRSKSANGAEMNYEIVRVLYKYLIEGRK